MVPPAANLEFVTNNALFLSVTQKRNPYSKQQGKRPKKVPSTSPPPVSKEPIEKVKSTGLENGGDSVKPNADIAAAEEGREEPNTQ